MVIEIPKIDKFEVKKTNSSEHFETGVMYVLQGQLCTILGIPKDSPKFLQFIDLCNNDIIRVAENNPQIKELIKERKFLTASQEIIKELDLETAVKKLDQSNIRAAA